MTPSASTDLTRGPIGPALRKLAWPVIAGEAFHVAFHLVDMAWVAPLGSWATAGLMTALFSLWIALAVLNLVAIGLGAHVSRAIGAGDREGAAHAASQALLLALGLSVVVGTAGALGAEPLMSLLSDDPRVIGAGSTYLRIMSLGFPISAAFHTLAAIMRACGNTRVPLIVGAVALVANAALAPVLIHGIGPLPGFGVAGSAIATLACILGGLAWLSMLAIRGHRDLPLRARDLARPDSRLLASLARVGAPYCAIGILYSLVYLWYSRLAGAAGAAALAALGIANRLESVTYLTADGFAVATSTFVGQNLGAGQAPRARAGAWHAARTMSALATVTALAMVAVPGLLFRPFTDDPAVIALGEPYLRVLALCQIFMGLEGVIGGAFAGAGDTVPPMSVHVVTSILRVPAAVLATRIAGDPLMGIAWSMTLTCIARALVLALWFRRDRWMTRALPLTRAPLPRTPLPPADAPDASGG